MGKGVKKVTGAVVDAVTNAPNTIFQSTKELVNATGNLGKAAVGANGGNYLEGLKDAATREVTAAANQYLTNYTWGMTSLNEGKGTNNLTSQGGKVLKAFGKGGPEAPSVPAAPATPDPNDPANMDPNMKAELENSKKKGRASTILGGGSDSVGTTSAKKTLLGSL